MRQPDSVNGPLITRSCRFCWWTSVNMTSVCKQVTGSLHVSQEIFYSLFFGSFVQSCCWFSATVPAAAEKTSVYCRNFSELKHILEPGKNKSMFSVTEVDQQCDGEVMGFYMRTIWKMFETSGCYLCIRNIYNRNWIIRESTLNKRTRRLQSKFQLSRIWAMSQLSLELIITLLTWHFQS